MSKVVVVKKKVIVEEIVIPGEYANDLRHILKFYDNCINKSGGKGSLPAQRAVTFARKVLREMGVDEED